MADRACDPTAVEVEPREIRSANILARVHLHAIDDGKEITLPKVIAQCRLTQRLGDDMTRMSAIESIDLLAPSRESRHLVVDRQVAVSDIVDLSAKCIDRVHPVPAMPG